MTSAESVAAFFKGKDVDLLINNAGVRRDVIMARMSEEDWDAVMDVNLKGAFLCARAVLKGMFRCRTGHIINIGSYSALSGPVGQCAYAASKAGLIALTKSVAAEGGRRNVRANCVLPGFLETKFIDGMDEKIIDQARDTHALGEFNTTQDAAKFILQLDAMRAVSGQVFQLDSRCG